MHRKLNLSRREVYPSELDSLVAVLRAASRRCQARYEQDEQHVDQLDLLAWSCEILPEHFRLPPSGMHRWLSDELEAARECRGKKLNVVGPRGSAKLTCATLAFVLREAVSGREPYIWIVSDTKHQAAAHLENVKTELRDNDRLAAEYPLASGVGPVCAHSAVVLRNGVMIEAFGTGQRIRGRRRRQHRPTLIVCDDLQNDNHIQSVMARDHSRAWFHGLLMKAGTKRTNVVNLGTALHRECLAMELHRTPGWTSRLFRAIERWPDDMPAWHEWEQMYCDVDRPDARSEARAFYMRNQPRMDAGAMLLWPEEEDLYMLMCMRAESGRTAFDREKQSTPVHPDLCEWPEEYFGDEIWFQRWPSDLRLRTLALDPSKGADSRRGDYSAFVMLGIGGDGALYLEANMARRPTPQIVTDGVELCRRFRPHALGIETNQFQELLGADFSAELVRQGLVGITPCSIENRNNKAVRIRRLGPLLAAQALAIQNEFARHPHAGRAA